MKWQTPWFKPGFKSLKNPNDISPVFGRGTVNILTLGKTQPGNNNAEQINILLYQCARNHPEVLADY